MTARTTAPRLTIRRYLRRVGRFAYSETRAFFRKATGDAPVVALAVVVYQAAFVAFCSRLLDGVSWRDLLPFIAPLVAWGIGPSVVLMCGVFCWAVFKAPKRMVDAKYRALLRSREARISERRSYIAAAQAKYQAVADENESLRNRIGRLEQPRPRIRIDFEYAAGILVEPQPQPPIVVRNAGDIEAKRVHIKPIRFGFENRKIVFRPVDVLGVSDRDRAKRVTATLYGLDLKDFKNMNFCGFLVQTYFAETRDIDLGGPDAPATNASRKAMKRVVHGALGIADVTIDLRATYFDDFDRRYVGRYRLSFRAMGHQLASAKIELLSDGEPTVVRVNAVARTNRGGIAGGIAPLT
jgi:hypothetical protein